MNNTVVTVVGQWSTVLVVPSKYIESIGRYQGFASTGNDDIRNIIRFDYYSKLSTVSLA